MTTRGSYVENVWGVFANIFSQNIDGFRPNDSQGF